MSRVEWLEWGKEAFDKARKEDKLILLDIHGVWCHWCHVMNDTTYSDDSVVSLVNERFVPIRVDTDKRPDVNDRYNMGGWPTTAVLTPKGELMAGGTYIPPNQMVAFLIKVLEAYEKKGGGIEKYAPKEDGERLGSKIDRSLVALFSEMIEYYYDPAYAGFGNSMKFPQPDLLSLLATMAWSNDRMRHMLQRTLEAMGNKGLYDHVEGGFFRYCTQRDWSVPHYEKMLEDNARIIDVFLRAYRLTGGQWYRDKARHALDYVMSDLFDKERNVFYGSQDADEEYYRLGLDERKDKKPPLIDRTAYVDWNCYAAVACLHASEALGEGFRRTGLACLDFILKNCVKGDKIFHFYSSGPDGPVVFTDYAALIEALLEAHKYTLEEHYIRIAERVLGMAKKLFMDKDMLFFDIPQEGGEGFLSRRTKKMDDNGAMAQSLLVLAFLTGNEGHREHCKTILESFVNEAKQGSLYASRYAEAAYLYLGGLMEVSIFGDAHEDDVRTAIELARGKLSKTIVIKLEKREGKSTPLAIICKDAVCRPADSLEELKAII